MEDDNIYLTNKKNFAGVVGEEFTNNYLYSSNDDKSKDKMNENEDVLNVAKKAEIEFKKAKGRPKKNCIEKLNLNEFKDEPFIDEDFLYNKDNKFNADHYNQCNIIFIKELYYKLLNKPFKKNTGKLISKDNLINGIHNEDMDIEGILDLQRSFQKNIDNIEKKEEEIKEDKIDEEDIQKIEKIVSKQEELEEDDLFENTNIDKIILNKDLSNVFEFDNSQERILQSEYKDYNKFLLALEKKSFENYKENENPDFLYPDLDDPKFSIKIAKKKEFYDHKYEDKMFDIKEQSELLCNADFELMPHQNFIKNFLSSYTPYNSLLLFHSVGTGKTCSAIGIAEETRNYYKYTNTSNQQIIIIASPNVQSNFKLQLFDPNKLQNNNGIWTLNTCVGNALISEINPMNSKQLTKKQIIKQINNIISTNYNFMGYIGFSNFISRLININENSGYTKKQIENIQISLIQKYFNNRLIIIDEVHNIRIADDNIERKQTVYLLMKAAKYANNMKLVLLSATPMYNTYKEIIWITNLLNLNDKRGIIKESDVFNSDGTFKKAENENSESGEELLQRKLIGYVSYIQGENPYSFPFRIYPNEFSPENVLKKEKYPNTQLNDSNLDFETNLPLYMVDMGEYQKKAYNIIIQNLKNNTQNEKLPNFENLESFGYSLLQKPLESLNIVYPKMEIEDLFDKDYSTLDKDLIKSKIYNLNNMDIVGKNGLRRIMNFETKMDGIKPIKFNYEYKPEILSNYGRIFSKTVLPSYSSKISNICNNVMKSKGIILIYSMYIEGGVIPIALALEELGFTRYSSSSLSKPLFKDPPTDPIDSIHMKPKKDLKNIKFRPAQYVLVTGDVNFSHNNAEDMKMVTNPNNLDGSQIKVVIISKAASEGLDFKNIRQVHIMEPWYNLNRIEQIIGRGVRNLSHCSLPFEERNVEIYMYAMNVLEEKEKKIEPADMYLYRLAEKKAKQIGQVTRLLKKNAIDCNLNITQTNFSIEKFKEFSVNNVVNIELSNGKKIKYTVGNKPYSSICDYMDNCNFECANNEKININEINNQSYNSFFAETNFDMIIKRIKQLFKEKAFYKKDELINEINLNRNYPREQILYSLTLFINNLNVIDNFGRRGYIINKGDFYLFQPIEIEDNEATTFERINNLDYKPDRLNIEVIGNKKFKIKELDDNNLSRIEDYEYYLNKIEDIVNNCLEENIDSNKIESNADWYTELKSTELKYFLFEKHNLTKENFKEYTLQHYLDCSSLKIRLILLNGIYNKTEKLNDVEENILKYFEKRMIYKNSNEFAVILKNDSDDNINNLYISNEGLFNMIDGEEYNEYIPLVYRKLGVSRENIHPVIGFMQLFKNESVLFKTKEFTSKYKNKGSVCKNANKEDTIRKLKCLLNIGNCQGINEKESSAANKHEYYYNKQELKQSIRKTGLCIITEFLFRHFDEEKLRNKRYFFSPEETALIDVPNL